MVFLEHASSPLTPCEGQAPQQSPSSLPLAASLSSFLRNEEVAIVIQEVWTKHGKTGSLKVYPDWTRVIVRFFFICIWFMSGNMVEYLMVIYTRKFLVKDHSPHIPCVSILSKIIMQNKQYLIHNPQRQSPPSQPLTALLSVFLHNTEVLIVPSRIVNLGW